MFLGVISIGNCAEAAFSLDEQSVFLATPKGLLELNLTTKSAHLLAALHFRCHSLHRSQISQGFCERCRLATSHYQA